jgi:hypothetical protein
MFTRFHNCSRLSEGAFVAEHPGPSEGTQHCYGRADGEAQLRENAVSHSMYHADRRTHLKVVVVGLFCATLVAAVGLFAHVAEVDNGFVPLVKAGQPTAMSGHLRAIQ